jgi:hypothetical protein
MIAVAISFVVLVCLSLGAEFLWSRWNAWHVQLSEKQVATSNMARALAQHAENTVKVADTVLLGMVERFDTDGTGNVALARLQKFLRASAAELPALHVLLVFDADGRQLVSSHRSGVSQVNGAVREYFRYHREHPGRSSHIGQPVRSLATGDWIITVSRRLDHADGSFAGVAVASINLRHFKHFYASFDIGAQGVIMLALDDGALLVRRAQDETRNRQNIADGPVFRHYRRSARRCSPRAPTASRGCTATGMSTAIRCWSRSPCRNRKSWPTGAPTPGAAAACWCCWWPCWPCWDTA